MREFARVAEEQDPGQVGEHLRARALADRVPADHPGPVPGDVTPPYRDEGEDEGQRHDRAEHEPLGGEEGAVGHFGEVVEHGHPQPRQRRDDPQRNQQPPGGTVPADPPAAQPGGELDGPQQAVHAGADDVRHDGHGIGEEAGVVRCGLGATGQLAQPEGAGEHRNGAEREQGDEYGPARSGAGHGESLRSAGGGMAPPWRPRGRRRIGTRARTGSVESARGGPYLRVTPGRFRRGRSGSSPAWSRRPISRSRPGCGPRAWP